MKNHHSKAQYFLLKLTIIASFFIMGCSTWPLSKNDSSSEIYNIEGKWSWQQEGPWHGTFVLEKNGNSYTGTLDDISEGTYGDKITDVKISKGRISFKRSGRHGVQYWQGKLKEENGRLKIVDGRWKKDIVRLPSFSAEKED